jgi:hypothetical protein
MLSLNTRFKLAPLAPHGRLSIELEVMVNGPILHVSVGTSKKRADGKKWLRQQVTVAL